MFVWTALDESADKLQKHAYIVAGILTAQSNWSRIERAWNKRLAKDGLAYFKTSEYRRLKGEFAKFSDENVYPKPEGRNAAREIFSDLSLILKSENHVGLALALNLSDYRKVLRSKRARKILPSNPYRLMYQTSMIAMALHIGHSEHPEVIAFLCDEHSKGSQLANSYASLKKANPNAAEYMGSLTFGSDVQWAPIQVADMVAGICKDYFVEYFSGRIPDEMKALQKVKSEIGTHIQLSYLDEVALRRIVDGNLLNEGRPSLRSPRQEKLFSNLFDIS
jgi:hypothetical protein